MELDRVKHTAERGRDAGRQVDAGKIEQTLLRMLLVFVVSKKSRKSEILAELSGKRQMRKHNTNLD